ncbi:MAG: sulfatase-like hydrolase/transferase, partial [Alphaproteobacteria bacterium]|nr:sulfatase-like hydrolase/transferase [Alphaproteobacteria bacterium]
LIDDAVGRVMGALHGTSAGENTVVVFMSDHGDYLGSHGLLLKGPLHYRALVRTPFIWADTHDRPAKNAATDALCGTLDFGRSILDRASIEPFNGMQGQSILDILDGNSDGADAMLIEDEGQRAYLGYTSPPKIRSLITKGWRLTVAHNADWGELYDLAHDPHEMFNLWDDTEFAAQKSELLFGLVRKQASLSDTSPWPTARA